MACCQSHKLIENEWRTRQDSKTAAAYWLDKVHKPGRHVRYYRILCGDSLELIETEVAQALSEQPEDVYNAFLVTFARLRLGRIQDLSADLAQLTHPHEWTAGERAVLCAIFRAAGGPAAVQFREGQTPAPSLLSEERRLLRPVRIPELSR